MNQFWVKDNLKEVSLPMLTSFARFIHEGKNVFKIIYFVISGFLQFRINNITVLEF